MTDDEEAEAKLCARCLLMPEKFLRADVTRLAKRKDIGDLLDDKNPCIPKLAARYGVSTVVMTMRLYELGILK